MSSVNVYSTIPKIRKLVEKGLSSYFDDMSSGEFEGANIYPKNSQIMVAVFLSASANHSIEDITESFQDVLSADKISDAYEAASNFIGKDQHLTLSVMGIARKLDIPEENLVIT